MALVVVLIKIRIGCQVHRVAGLEIIVRSVAVVGKADARRHNVDVVVFLVGAFIIDIVVIPQFVFQPQIHLGPAEPDIALGHCRSRIEADQQDKQYRQGSNAPFMIFRSGHLHTSYTFF